MFNIKRFYMVLTLHLCILYRSQNKVQHLPYVTEYQEYFLGG